MGSGGQRWIDPAVLPSPIRSLHAGLTARWDAMAPNARGAFLVSVGSFAMVLMAIVVKHLGARLDAFQVLLFRSGIGFLLVLPIFLADPREPFRTKRAGLHFARGLLSAAGNFCLFWTITHLLLADSMALQFSRPLFMIPLAMIMLGEIAGPRRIVVTLLGFAGILVYLRPEAGMLNWGALVGVAGAVVAALVVVTIKHLATTESTRVIMFHYAAWNTVLALIPALYVWVTPTAWELVLLVLVGILGISGQTMITHGYTMGDTTALSPLDYSRIVYAAILGWLIFGEVPGLWSWVGMALIVSASLYLVLTEGRKGKA